MDVLANRKTITLTLCFVGLICLAVGIFLLAPKERSSVASQTVGSTPPTSDANNARYGRGSYHDPAGAESHVNVL